MAIQNRQCKWCNSCIGSTGIFQAETATTGRCKAIWSGSEVQNQSEMWDSTWKEILGWKAEEVQSLRNQRWPQADRWWGQGRRGRRMTRRTRRNRQANPAVSEKEMMMMRMTTSLKSKPRNLQQNQSPKSHDCQRQNPNPSKENLTPDFSPVWPQHKKI